jgi:hypothetical protein
VFQTLYPPATHSGPAPVQVGLLTPGTPEADAVLRWIESEDPALAAQPVKAPVPGLQNVPYVPSYAVTHARPAMVAADEAPLPYPAGVSGLELIKMAASHPASSQPTPASMATAIRFSDGLAGAAAGPMPAFDLLRPGASGPLQPARFLLGVSPTGEVQYVFLQDSSGDKALDLAAGRLLEKVGFRAGGSGIEWGFATLFWGSAVFGQPARGGNP